MDGNAIRPRHIYKMTWQEVSNLYLFERALNRCEFFGLPYGIRSTTNGQELCRLAREPLPIGCLNQPWAGPLVALYPEGNWMLPPKKSWTMETTHDTQRT